MRYETTEMIVKVVLPSEIYAGQLTKEGVQQLLINFQVVGFRPPAYGDIYLGKNGRFKKRGFDDIGVYLYPGPRFIVTPRTLWE